MRGIDYSHYFWQDEKIRLRSVHICRILITATDVYDRKSEW